jgi:hypothetical protein
MPMAHKILFGACFVMFLIATMHLALLIHEASNGVLPTPTVGRALIILATFQVGRNDFYQCANILKPFQFVISDLILIWR